MDAEPYGGNAYKRPAYAITELFNEVNAAFPGRSKKSDGILGDQAHAQRASGHNPNSKGIVCAGDITHDRAHCDGTVVAETFRADRDDRLLYVIWNHRIFDGLAGTEPFIWRPYDGADPHTGHVHVSLRQEARYYDDRSPWGIGADMPLSNADLDAIEARFEKWWASKTFTPPGEAGAPGKTYRDSALRNIWAHVIRVEKKLDAFIKSGK